MICLGIDHLTVDIVSYHLHFNFTLSIDFLASGAMKDWRLALVLKTKAVQQTMHTVLD